VCSHFLNRKPSAFGSEEDVPVSATFSAPRFALRGETNGFPTPEPICPALPTGDLTRPSHDVFSKRRNRESDPLAPQGRLDGLVIKIWRDCKVMPASAGFSVPDNPVTLAHGRFELACRPLLWLLVVFSRSINLGVPAHIESADTGTLTS